MPSVLSNAPLSISQAVKKPIVPLAVVAKAARVTERVSLVVLVPTNCTTPSVVWVSTPATSTTIQFQPPWLTPSKSTVIAPSEGDAPEALYKAVPTSLPISLALYFTRVQVRLLPVTKVGATIPVPIAQEKYISIKLPAPGAMELVAKAVALTSVPPESKSVGEIAILFFF